MDTRLFKDVPCPVCGSWERSKVVQEDRVTIQRCKKCGLMFSSPQLTDEGRLAFFNKDYKPVPAEDQYKIISGRDGRYVAKTVKLLGNRRGRWLDVGCAAGVLLTEAEKAGFSAFGFEVCSPYESTLRAKKGWDIRIGGSLKEAGFEPKSFDVISLIDTLYYVPDPIGELRVIGSLLKDDGILVCEVTNTRYMLMKDTGLIPYLRWGKWSNMRTGDSYIIHFTFESLCKVLAEAGFKVVRDGIGEPWMGGNPIGLMVKRSWFYVARVLKLFGIHLGVRIDVWAVKAQTNVKK